ncbi:MAG: glycosyltransferase family 2 protein [Chloroflexota bacterium]|nr:MAG: glycosyltransferase family 2 protein [Chloroflexota bacterium]
MAENYPLVTVIMPVYNEEAFIARSLGAVLAQDYPSERLEVIVADGMSQDATRQIIQSLPGAERVRILDNPQRLQAAGMNMALAHAKGEIIVRVDGHTIIAPDYVRNCVRALQTTEAWNVGGGMHPVGQTPMGKAIAAAGRSAFAVPTAFHVSDRPCYTDTVYMGAWWRWALERVGGYDPSFAINEDYELNYRLRAAGGRIYFSPAIRSEYYCRQSLAALWRQYYRYGIGRVQTLRKHPRSLRLRQVVAPLFVAGVFGGAALAPFNALLRALWLLGLALYAATNVFFSWRTARRYGMAHLPRLPLVFLTIHIAWGLGFWRGLLKK